MRFFKGRGLMVMEWIINFSRRWIQADTFFEKVVTSDEENVGSGKISPISV